MKTLMIAALVSAQLAAAQPAFAAGFDADQPTRAGLFAGAQLKIPLGGARAGPARVGLTLAPSLQNQRSDGTRETRIGEGFELSFGSRQPELRLAGTRLDRIGAPDGERANISTIGWIAIGVGATVVVVVSAFAICMSDNECNPSE